MTELPPDPVPVHHTLEHVHRQADTEWDSLVKKTITLIVSSANSDTRAVTQTISAMMS